MIKNVYMNEFDLQIAPSLKSAIREFIERERINRDIKQSIINHQSSIDWLKKQLATKKLSQANIAEYNHQIKYHELNITFLTNG